MRVQFCLSYYGGKEVGDNGWSIVARNRIILMTDYANFSGKREQANEDDNSCQANPESVRKINSQVLCIL